MCGPAGSINTCAMKWTLTGPLKPAPADERGSDSDDPVGGSADSPGLHGHLLGPMQLGRFGDDSRQAYDKNAPPA